MELPVIGGVGDVRSPDSELLKDVDLRFQVPCGVVGLAEPGVASSDGDHVRHMRPCANRKLMPIVLRAEGDALVVDVPVIVH